MAESSLSLALTDLQGEVGTFMGWGADATAWSTTEKAAIAQVVKSGLRQFYFPPPLENESTSHTWSFLTPVASVVLASGAQAVRLPDDFGGAEGQVAIYTTSGAFWYALDVGSIGAVYQKYAELPTATGRPQLACVEPLKGTDGTSGQRQQLRAWPQADQDYTLKLQYYLLPDALSGAFPYAYGGMQHAETVLESCLAIAEQRLDDAVAVHSQKFMERLAASVGADRRGKPQTLGICRDASDRPAWTRPDQHGYGLVAYNGVQY